FDRSGTEGAAVIVVMRCSEIDVLGFDSHVLSESVSEKPLVGAGFLVPAFRDGGIARGEILDVEMVSRVSYDQSQIQTGIVGRMRQRGERADRCNEQQPRNDLLHRCLPL